MKLITLLMLVLAIGAFNVQAAEVELNWNPNQESDLKGYRIYQGKSSRAYEDPVEILCSANNAICCKYTATGLEDGTYYWTATAFDKNGNESEYAKEISLTIDTVAPGSPGNFTVTIKDTKSVSISVDE